MKSLTYLSAVAALVGATSAFAGSALSPESNAFTNEGAVGPWTVYADSTRKSCLIEGVGANGNVVQMGLTEDKNVGYVGVFTKDDINVRDGNKEELTILVNDVVYRGPAYELDHKVADGYKGGYVEVTNPDFVKDLQKGDVLVAFPDNQNKGGVIVDLKGSYKAIEAAMACNEKISK